MLAKQNERDDSKQSSFFAFKDFISISISCLALALALTSAWFQYFRSEAHLKVIISGVRMGHENKNSTSESLTLKEFNDISLLNDGNRPILLTRISRMIGFLNADTVAMIKKTRDDANQKLALSNGAGKETNWEGRDRAEIALEDVILGMLPKCSSNYDRSLYIWKGYKQGSAEAKPGSVVIKPGEILVMNELEFPEVFFKLEALSGDQNEAYLLSCLKFEYVKHDGAAGSRALPALITEIRKNITAGKVKQLSSAAYWYVGNLQSVD